MAKSIILKIIPIYEIGESSSQYITSYVIKDRFFRILGIIIEFIYELLRVSNNSNTTVHKLQHLRLNNIV